jgi:hypothetical protein
MTMPQVYAPEPAHQCRTVAARTGSQALSAVDR